MEVTEASISIWRCGIYTQWNAVLSYKRMKLSCLWASLVTQLVKNLPAMWETWVRFLVGKIPGRRERLPTPVLWPGEFHELYSPWGCKELGTLNDFRWFTDADDITLMAGRGTKEPFDEGERREWKNCLNSTFKKWRSWYLVPSPQGKYGEKWKQWQTLFWGTPKSLPIVTAAMKLTDACSLEEKLWQT